MQEVTSLSPIVLAFIFGAGGGAVLAGIGTFVIFILNGRRESRRQVREERRTAYAEFVSRVDEAVHLLWIALGFRASTGRMTRSAVRDVIVPIKDSQAPFLRSAAQLQIIGSKRAVVICRRLMLFAADCTEAILSGPRRLPPERVRELEALLAGFTPLQEELMNAARKDLGVGRLHFTRAAELPATDDA